MGARDCLATLMALLLPPVAVWMVSGCGAQLCINLLLCLLGWIPGIIHALFVICAAPDHPRQLPTSAPPQQQPGQAAYAPPQQVPYPIAQPAAGPPPPGYPPQPAPGYPSTQPAAAAAYPAVPKT